MRVLVTGATGFVGSHVTRELLLAGHSVRAIERTVSRRPSGLGAVDWVPGDILDRASLDRAAVGVEAVIHIAASLSHDARRSDEQRRVNVEGTRNTLDAAASAGVKRFVHTSSVAAIGRPAPGEIIDESHRYDWPVGLTYNQTKHAAEQLVRAENRFETVCVNPALVLGPNDITARTVGLFRAVKLGLGLVAPPGGITVCDVRDIASAHVAALDRGTAGARYILGGPHVTYRELLAQVATLMGRPKPLFELPTQLMRLSALPLEGLERLGAPLPRSPAYIHYFFSQNFYSSAAAERDLGYHMRPLEETLADTLAWYREQGRV